MPITEIKEKFGSRVKFLRNIRGLSQGDLSSLAGLHRTYISSIEAGKRNVSLINIEKLAKALRVRIFELFKSL